MLSGAARFSNFHNTQEVIFMKKQTLAKLERFTEMAKFNILLRNNDRQELRKLEGRLAANAFDCEVYELFLRHFKADLDKARSLKKTTVSFSLLGPPSEGAVLEKLSEHLHETGLRVLIRTEPPMKGDRGLQLRKIDISIP